MTNSKTNTYRIGVLEANYKEMDKKLDRIMSNDLPHIRESVIKLNGKIDTMEENINGRIDSLKTRVGILSTLQIGAIVIILGAIISKVL